MEGSVAALRLASPPSVSPGAMAGARQPQNDGLRSLPLSGHVGFDTLPDQLVNKSIKQGFCFNILCIGETGSGKSTLINSLFNTSIDDPMSTHFHPNVRLKAQRYELHESNVRLKLTVVSTVGFGDQLNKEDSYQPIVNYIDAQFEAYLQEELKIKRSVFNYHDTRIHVCLYIISPTGHSLKTLDLLTMKSLDSKGHLPFAVVGSTEEVKIGNKMVKARQYPWGIVQVENENHCDFVKLREMLICTNMEDLIEQTHACHYELYRRCRLQEMGFRDNDPENKPVSLQEAYEAKRREFYFELQRKEEEMRQKFVQRVKEKEAVLKEAEQQIQANFEHLMLMHQEEKLKLEKKRKALEDEIALFNMKKANAELLQTQPMVSTPLSLKRDKDRKNSSFT
ncbi:septin-10 isoform X3 [Numida meleagris]|uniref:septin-10 isoform X3 n=1 Tax=Numida meleagris TaxID=8996 RepID=UPI000B3E063F|nr:septin-10 isoform X3 [Numida meleagris]